MRLRSYIKTALITGAATLLVAEDARAVMTFPASQAVSTDWDRAGGNVEDFGPRLSVGPGGGATVAWNQGGTDFPVHVQRVAPNGTLGTERQVSDTGDQTFDFGMVTASDGTTTIVWLNDDGVAEPSVMLRRLLPDGTLDGPFAEELSDDSVGASRPSLDIDEDDRVTVAWERGGDIEAVRVDAAGNPGTIIDVADTGALERFPEVAVDGADRALVVFGRGPNGSVEQIARRINANGTLEADRLVAPAGGGQTFDPAVAFDANNRATIAWIDQNASFQSRVEARTLDATGTLGTTQQLGTRVDEIDDPAVTIDSANRARVAWANVFFSGPNDNTVQLRRLDAAGVPLGTAAQNLGTGRRPTIEADSQNRLVVIYKSDEGTTTDPVLAVRVAAGGAVGSTRTVSSIAPYGYFAAELDASDRPVVAYLSSSVAGDQEQYLTRGTLSPPQTTITSGPAEGSVEPDGTVDFAFSSNGDTLGEAFECSVDGAAFTECTSPVSTASLALGSHSFAARAIDTDGTDASPATRNFTVAAPDTALDGLFAKAKKTQKQKGKKLQLKVDVGAGEAATAEVRGKLKVGKKSFKLKTTTKSVVAGQRKTVKVKLQKSKDQKKALKALDKDKGKASLTVKLNDDAGNSASKKLTVKVTG